MFKQTFYRVCLQLCIRHSPPFWRMIKLWNNESIFCSPCDPVLCISLVATRYEEGLQDPCDPTILMWILPFFDSNFLFFLSLFFFMFRVNVKVHFFALKEKFENNPTCVSKYILINRDPSFRSIVPSFSSNK